MHVHRRGARQRRHTALEHYGRDAVRRSKVANPQQLTACGEDALQLSGSRPLDHRASLVRHRPARGGESGLERQRAALSAKEHPPRIG